MKTYQAMPPNHQWEYGSKEVKKLDLLNKQVSVGDELDKARVVGQRLPAAGKEGLKQSTLSLSYSATDPYNVASSSQEKNIKHSASQLHQSNFTSRQQTVSEGTNTDTVSSI